MKMNGAFGVYTLTLQLPISIGLDAISKDLNTNYECIADGNGRRLGGWEASAADMMGISAPHFPGIYSAKVTYLRTNKFNVMLLFENEIRDCCALCFTET